VSVRAPASGRDRDQGQRDSPPEVRPFVDHRPGALLAPQDVLRRWPPCDGGPALLLLFR